MTIPVIIDTDPGLGEVGSDIDDGLAIALALASPELEVLGLTVVNGNVDALTGVDVARRLLRRLEREDIPVVLGATAPLTRDMESVRALFAAALPSTNVSSEGRDLEGPTTTQHAADFLSEQVAARPGEVTVVAIGPMTNLALAMERHPAFAQEVKELVLMAGSATTFAQNVTTVGDFNTYVDPEALDVVLRSGAPVRMVGIDQTSRVMLTRDDAARLRRSPSPFGRWAADCADAWIDYLGRAFPARVEHQTACFLHDPLVIAALTHPELLTWEGAEVTVALAEDLTRGLVVADRGLALARPAASSVQVATDTDVARFRDLFFERISQV